MANTPPSMPVYDFINGEVRILLPTLLLDPTPDGSPVGTGGPGLVTAEPTPSTNLNPFMRNRVIEFLDDRYVLAAAVAGEHGVYKKNQGGAGQWGQVYAFPANLDDDSWVSGLHILHPNGVPTLCFMWYDLGGELYISTTTNGTAWNTLLLQAGVGPGTGPGVAIPYRDSLWWWTGAGATGGHLRSYDLELGTLTSYGSTPFGSHQARNADLHVYKNVVFIVAFSGTAGYEPELWKIQAATYTFVYDFAANNAQAAFSTGVPAHHCMFTDQATGDMIIFIGGRDAISFQGDTKVFRIENALTGLPTVTNITASVLGAVQGADKYTAGVGPNNHIDRSWDLYVDNDTDPLNPRYFLYTHIPGGTFEMWEWKGHLAEIELVSLGAGLSVNQFAMPYVKFGGGHRSVIAARIEIGDPANEDAEDVGGRRFFWRAIGSGGPFTGTFYVSPEEEVPDQVGVIVAGSLVVESGVPATVPAISGNTITNITPDDGTVLYSVVIDLTSATPSIGAGSPGRIMGDLS